MPSLDIVVSADGFFEDGPVCGSPGTTERSDFFVERSDFFVERCHLTVERSDLERSDHGTI